MWTRWTRKDNTPPVLTENGDRVLRFAPGSKLFLGLLAPASILSLCDAFITQRCVGTGLAGESNVVMAGLIANNSFLAFKILGVILSIALLWAVHKRYPLLAGMATLFIAIFYTGVLVWNLAVLA
jgi:hypothetical protein